MKSLDGLIRDEMTKSIKNNPSRKRAGNTNPRREGLRLSSVTTAIHLLKTFTLDEQELGISQIAQRLGIAKSTVHRLTSSLLEEGLLYQNPENKRYSLGIGLFTLGSMVRAKLDISSKARPYLNELREKIGENARLAMLDAENVVFLYDLESFQTMHLRSSIGLIKPAFCTAEGLCLLANLNEAELSNVLSFPREMRTSRTIINEKKIRARLVKVRRLGYAIEDEESEEGTRCLAAPIFQEDGRVEAAIGIAGPRLRLKKSDLAKIAPQVMVAAGEISRKLGY